MTDIRTKLGDQKYSISLNKLGNTTNIKISLNYFSTDCNGINIWENKIIRLCSGATDVCHFLKDFREELKNCSAVLTNFGLTEENETQLYREITEKGFHYLKFDFKV